jgi:hypothetical protein
MHIKNFTLLVLCILLATAPLHAQDDNNNSENNGENKEERASGLLKELLEFRIAKDAMGIYFLTNVNHPATGNAPLRDSIVSLMDSTNICFSVKDTMELDHFWSFLCNTKDYKTQKDGFSDYLEALDFDDESYVETDLYKAGYDIHFIPQWDKSQAPPKDESRKYKMKIYTKIPSGLKDDVSNTDLEQAANEPIQENTINFVGFGNHQPNKEAVNKGFFAGFDYIKELNVKKEKIEYFIVNGKDTIPCKDNPDLCFAQKDTIVEFKLIANNPDISFDNVTWKLDGEKQNRDSTIQISFKKQKNIKIKIKKKVEASGKDYILNSKIKIYKNPIVRFEKKNGFDGEYGFDNADYTALKESGDYEKLNIYGHPNTDYFVPWMTVTGTENYTLNVDVSNLARSAGKDENFEVRFVPSDKNNITINNQSSLRVNYNELKSIRNISIRVDENSELDEPHYIKVYSQNSKILGKLAILKQDKIVKDVYFVYVDNGNRITNILDHNKVLDFLNNNSHNQIFVEWESQGVDTMQINFDSPNNSTDALNRINSYYLRNYNPEKNAETPIFYLTNIEIPSSEGYVGGAADMISFLGAIIFKQGKKEHVAHEFGHLNGLPHTFCEENAINCSEVVNRDNINRYIPKKQSNNFMDYFNTKEVFYLYQWHYMLNYNN